MRSIEDRIESALLALSNASKLHSQAAEKLCNKIEKSNGQIKGALLNDDIGDTC